MTHKEKVELAGNKIAALKDELKALGVNFVGVAAIYSATPKDTHFHTAICATDEAEEFGGDLDHTVLDAVREIADAWSGVAH